MPVIIDNQPKPIEVTIPKSVHFQSPRLINTSVIAKALTEWRRLSLDHLRLQNSAVVGPPSVAVPLTTAQEIVAELSNCRKAADVRTIFENRINALKRGTNGAQPDATAELKRANDLLERVLPFVEMEEA
jgi:hypothetical protein